MSRQCSAKKGSFTNTPSQSIWAPKARNVLQVVIVFTTLLYQSAASAAPNPNGSVCTTMTDCTSGFCVDGVCCDTECNQDCKACKASLKVSQQDDGICDNASVGTGCGEGQCIGLNLKLGSCDGVGQCQPLPGTIVDCTPHICLNNACTTSCQSYTDCAANSYCGDDQMCHPKLANGTECSSPTVCESSHCVDNYCCDAECNSPCSWCANPENPGVCGPAPQGQPIEGHGGCLGEGVCGGYCDGQVLDECYYPAEGTSCGQTTCDGDTSSAGSLCDGTGQCVQQESQECSPFGCNSDTGLCKTHCVTENDCSTGSVCSTDGLCSQGNNQCVNSTTIEDASGSRTDCTPYRCEAGHCTKTCSSDSDCASSAKCTDTQCIETNETGGSGGSSNTPTPAKSGSDGGCTLPPHSSVENQTAVGWLLMLLGALRRRSFGRATRHLQ